MEIRQTRYKTNWVGQRINQFPHAQIKDLKTDSNRYRPLGIILWIDSKENCTKDGGQRSDFRAVFNLSFCTPTF